MAGQRLLLAGAVKTILSFFLYLSLTLQNWCTSEWSAHTTSLCWHWAQSVALPWGAHSCKSAVSGEAFGRTAVFLACTLIPTLYGGRGGPHLPGGFEEPHEPTISPGPPVGGFALQVSAPAAYHRTAIVCHVLALEQKWTRPSRLSSANQEELSCPWYMLAFKWFFNS